MRNRGKGSEILCKVTLAVLFVLGIVLILGGVWGNGQFETAGFSQENAFSLIYRLTSESDALYRKGIEPAIRQSGTDAAAMGEISRELLTTK